MYSDDISIMSHLAIYQIQIVLRGNKDKWNYQQMKTHLWHLQGLQVTTSSKVPEIEQSNDSVVKQHEPPLNSSDTVELRCSTRIHRPADQLM